MTFRQRREKLRSVLAGATCIRPGSVYDAISIRIAEDLGFEVGMFGGSVASLAVLGDPDIALITLTELAEQLDGVRNLHVSVKEAGDQIIFLRRVEPGCADRSYGIEVARLAGLPLTVIERARDILLLHEKSEQQVSEELTPRSYAPVQIALFEPVNHEIAERIRSLKVDELRPIEALQLLHQLQEELKRR